MTRWVYVAGYGRSGSTLLGRLLGERYGWFAAGEVKWLIHAMGTGGDVPCTCGAPRARCPVWSAVWEHTQPAVAALGGPEGARAVQARAESWRALARRSAVSAGYCRWAAAVAAGIESAARGRAENVVDTSKSTADTAGRALALDRCGIDVQVVHMVRDGRGVCWSQIRAAERRGGTPSRGRRLAIVAKTALSWDRANLAAWVTRRRLGPRRALVLSYEAFVADPDRTLAQVAALGAASVPAVAAPELHLMAGNRVRMATGLRVAPDDDWKRNLSRAERAVCWVLGWPSAWFHGRILAAEGLTRRAAPASG